MIKVIKQHSKIALLILSASGLVIAALSGLSSHFTWFAGLCAQGGSGCRETAGFAILSLPLWLWGVLFYISMLLIILRATSFTFLWAAVAFGFELNLMRIMFSIDIICPFCLVNFAVVLLLVAVAFKRSTLWQSLSVSLAVCLISYPFLLQQNESLLSGYQGNKTAIIASVRDHKISRAELESATAARTYPLEREIYEQEKEQLDRMITGILLQQEADRQKVPLEELMNQLAKSHPVQVNEQEIDDFYVRNEAQWRTSGASKADLRARIKDYLMRQKTYRTVADYARSMAPEEAVVSYLQEPPPPMAGLDVDDAPALGPQDAPVTVIEFSDYLCPACRKMHETTRVIKEMYKDRIRWVFKDFPLSRHEWSKKAAEAARCAGEQGKFWEYQDILFAGETDLNSLQLKLYARDLGLDTEQFDACLDTGRYERTIGRNLEAAKKAGVNSTPTFVVNGVPITGPLEVGRFKDLIDFELGRQREKLARDSRNRAASNLTN